MIISQFREYLELEKKYSGHTLSAYQADLRSFAQFLLSEYNQEDFGEVNYQQIRQWIVVLAENGLSNRSINRKISSLKSFYTFLLKTRQIEVSPLAKHTSLKTSQKAQVPFSEKEVEEALALIVPEGFEDYRDKLVLEIFYTTGVRRAELLGIEIADLDLQRRLLKIRGKRNKERIVPLLASVVPSIEMYLKERKCLLHQKNISTSILILDSLARPLSADKVGLIVKKYFSQISSKLKKSPHVLRHSFATHLLNQGADINSVKELLGHSSLAATQIYTHGSLAELKSVYQNSHPRTVGSKEEQEDS